MDLPKKTTHPHSVAFPAGDLCESYGFGLTKREYFASIALQGMLSNPQWQLPRLQVVSLSVEYADALINELNR